MNTTLILLAFLVTVFVIIIVIGNRYRVADWNHWGINLLDGWLRLYCKKFHRQDDFLIELPPHKKIILAANHLTSIDPLVLITASNRPIRFMIAKEEYNRPLLHWIFKFAGCIPVDREGRVEKAFRNALRAIDSGEVLAVFPQGGIHSAATPRKQIKQGIIKLSELSGCDILPVRMSGFSAPGTMLKSLYSRSCIKVEVSSLVSSKQSQSDLFRCSMSDWLVGSVKKIEI